MRVSLQPDWREQPIGWACPEGASLTDGMAQSVGPERAPRALMALRWPGMTERTHRFHAVAFVENLSLKEVVRAFPGAKLTAYELHAPLAGGDVFAYTFGAVVFREVDES